VNAVKASLRTHEERASLRSVPSAEPSSASSEWARWASAFVSPRMRRDNRRKSKGRPSVDFVAAHVSASMDISVPELRSHRRGGVTLEARLVTYYLCRTLTTASSLEIGRILGRDHSSVLNGVRSAERAINTDATFAAKVDALRQMIEESYDIFVTASAHTLQKHCPLCRQQLDERV